MEISNKGIFLSIAFVVLSILYFFTQSGDKPVKKQHVSVKQIQTDQDEMTVKDDVAKSVKENHLEKEEKTQEVKVLENKPVIPMEQPNIDALRKEAALLTREDLNNKIHALRTQMKATKSRVQRRKLRQEIKVYRQQRHSSRRQRVHRN